MLVPPTVNVYCPPTVVEPEASVIVAVEGDEPFCASEEGEIKQVAPAGAPLQLSEIAWSNPF